MGRFAKGPYHVKNPKKYVGKKTPTYRSSWELTFMKFCDTNDSILEWASEAIRIPYFNHAKGKKTTYVPDFLIVYQDKNNNRFTELIEIKPKKQSVLTERLNSKDRAIVHINHAKWKAAAQWCKQRGIIFRVITEDEIYKK